MSDLMELPDHLSHLFRVVPIICSECGNAQSFGFRAGKWIVTEYHRDDCPHQERHNAETEVEVRD